MCCIMHQRCGAHWIDDAPAFGGSNVWLNALEGLGVAGVEPTEAVEVETSEGARSLAKMSFAGKDWYLVRRDAGDLKTGGKTCRCGAQRAAYCLSR
jgi:hypothetical protein